MMNIAIDISPLKIGHFLQHRVRGTGLYLENLNRSLKRYYPQNKYIFFTRGEKLPENVDLVHYPYFEPFFLTLPLISRNKFVVTVHDLTPLVFPKYFPCGIKGKIKWSIQKLALKRAKAIIADSQSSKKDIVHFAGISQEKITVVYLAAGEEFKKINNPSKINSLKKQYDLPDKFVLYVGDVTWNKNLPNLIEAVKKSQVPFVIVGKAIAQENFDEKNPWNQDLVKVKKLVEGDRNIFVLGYVSQDDLVSLYNAATVFAMPSFYEGFALPILEAMSCGCPVVTSREGSIGEIAEEAAFYVNAYDVQSIAGGLEKVFKNSSLQKSLSEKGTIQSGKFSWEKTASDTMKVYKSSLRR